MNQILLTTVTSIHAAIATELDIDALLTLIVKIDARIQTLEAPRIKKVQEAFDNDDFAAFLEAGKDYNDENHPRLTKVAKTYLLEVMAPLLPGIVNRVAGTISSKLTNAYRPERKYLVELTAPDVMFEVVHALFDVLHFHDLKKRRTLEVGCWRPEGDDLPF